ncbi:Putative rRNA-processing protein FCF1 homolog [Podospora comata]|uniref:rRNA-processing protein FCF1 homolog n=1 Tax=Podospora comata TaxID=48703 RepID=A0ABY6S4H5_PODCO|nr:Putative rRNA-processing protein FCF1 homolog [Podospora comata]
MGVAKKVREFRMKRVIGKNDDRRKTEAEKKKLEIKKKEKELVREVPQAPSSMFFEFNTSLVPPYQIIVDTNFLSRSIQAKLPLLESAMDALYASVNIIITDCVMAELEKLGPKYRMALMIARDERWTKLTCDHKGTYADDCIVDRVQKNRIYIVATNDRDLKRRLRKIPGVPILGVQKGKYAIERLPGAPAT